MAADPVAEESKPAPAADPALPGTPETKATPPKLPSRAGFGRRLQVGTNVIVQLVLLAAILLFANGYAFKHFHQFDYSRDRKYALSDRTKQFLRSLSKPVKLIVFMTAQDPLQGDVANLAVEYRDAQTKFLSIEVVDPYRNLSRATEIQAKYKLAQQENVVILDCENRTKIITDEKMAEVDHSGEVMGQPPQITAFTGEQAITAGLIEVSEGKKSNVYFVQGHGEAALGKGTPLEAVGSLLEAEHLDALELNLLNVPTIPADASVVLLLGGHYDLTDREVTLLSDYWDKGGRLLILLNPDSETPHLVGLLGRWGIRPENDRVLQTLNLGNMTGIVRDVLTQFQGNTLIASQLAGLTPLFPGGTQSLTLTPEVGAPQNMKIEPLLLAAKGYWGETDYKDLENTGAENDPAKDKQAPLYIAATAEKGALGDKRVSVSSSRLIVFGNSHFVEADAIDEKLANVFVSSLNWLLEREALIGIAPKQIRTYTLNLPEQQIGELFWMLVLAIPAVCALLGVIVWWWRRRT